LLPDHLFVIGYFNISLILMPVAIVL